MSAIDKILEELRSPSREGHEADSAAARAELQRLRDAELMLRALIPCGGVYGGVKAPGRLWTLDIAGGKRVPDDGTGLPLLTDAVREALKEKR